MKKSFLKYFFLSSFCLFKIYSQCNISGNITDESGYNIEQVLVVCKEIPSLQTFSDKNGNYSLTVPTNTVITLVFQSVNHHGIEKKFVIENEKNLFYHPVMYSKSLLSEVEVTGMQNRMSESINLNAKIFNHLPTPTGNIEDLIKTQIGVSSRNELSSGYSVRGGNFDENLIYVNDIEIYRPFLVRSGQQEGLSFANPAMVGQMEFSAGGFEARYGDKLSSVLDIQYRRPYKFASQGSAGFQGGMLQAEGISANHLFSWNVGARYRSTRSLVRKMDTKGQYNPSAGDVQGFFTFLFSEEWSLELLGNANFNRFEVMPQTRETNFGTVNNALRLTVFMGGRELMQYLTLTGASSLIFKPNANTRIKWIQSVYNTREEERYTVLGQYFIDQLEADLGKPNFGQVAFNRGVGSFLNNGRNTLNANVWSEEIKAFHVYNKKEIFWGLRWQMEKISDRMNEWRLLDSADFSIPWSPNEIILNDVIKAKNNVISQRVMAYGQFKNHFVLSDSSELSLHAGIRTHYWTWNRQTVVSPRAGISWKPKWKKDWIFRLSGGLYHQPPFYREIRNIKGNISKDVKAQLSYHAVLSADYVYTMWKRPFKLLMSAYYKHLAQVNPYEIDNVRIRYFANNRSTGYATGFDLRVNGEFVKGVESWMNIGILQTMEYSIDNVYYERYNKFGQKIIKGYTFDQVAVDSVRIDPGYIPRPSDQRINFSMFFQDYIPQFPWCKFNLTIIFGTGLPFGPPNHLRYQQVFRMPPYRRVDAGFAFNLLKENRAIKTKNITNKIKEAWLFVEVFNLLDIENTVSYNWVQDVTGSKLAVPNYLTGRVFNVRLSWNF
ncbi:MAG: TonB-dependent receptor [Bacteroidia bacterium]|nr:TonB-dependent receptor [Bacteroidia bacterium]